MQYFHALLSLSLLLAFSATAQDEPALKVGDAAPKIAASEWLKGEAVESFKEGDVYVIEFWATWCGPCITAIPHITELQAKHKDVTFIGMNVFERDPDKARAFVKKMGKKMDYTVALQEDEKMADTWMKAAGQGGIPCSFIIDGDGDIAWIGHPMKMEPVLEEVITGDFDADKWAKTQKLVKAAQGDYMKAMRAENWDDALKSLDALGKADASMGVRADMMKFQLLLKNKKDADAAYKIAKDFPKTFKKDATLCNEAAWFIVDEKNLPRRDLDLAMKLATKGVKLTKRKDAAILDTLARVHWEKDEVVQAIKIQTEAVAAADDDKMKKELKKVLNNYLEDEAL